MERCTRCGTEIDQFSSGECRVCDQQPKTINEVHCHDCAKVIKLGEAHLIVLDDNNDVQVCIPCAAKRSNGLIVEVNNIFFVYDWNGKLRRKYPFLKDAETYLNRCRAQKLRHDRKRESYREAAKFERERKKPPEKKFVPPSHFTPKPKQRALAELKPNYIGITYPDGPDAATWAGCGKGEHLLDEVISGLDHYLVCDACGLEIYISKIVTR